MKRALVIGFFVALSIFTSAASASGSVQFKAKVTGLSWVDGFAAVQMSKLPRECTANKDRWIRFQGMGGMEPLWMLLNTFFLKGKDVHLAVSYTDKGNCNHIWAASTSPMDPVMVTQGPKKYPSQDNAD